MAAGGVGEVVRDGVNGLLVAPGDAEALAVAVRRYFTDDELQTRLRKAAASSVEAYAPARVFGELETTLLRVVRA
jgi:glycosyltransferase involved in cell wall biosynthesis